MHTANTSAGQAALFGNDPPTHPDAAQSMRAGEVFGICVVVIMAVAGLGWVAVAWVDACRDIKRYVQWRREQRQAEQEMRAMELGMAGMVSGGGESAPVKQAGRGEVAQDGLVGEEDVWEEISIEGAEFA